MPTYQYECGACGHGFEVLQSMLEKKLKKCPKCGKPKLHRLIGAGSGIIFKGTGFYETDYKRKDALPSGGKSEAHSAKSASSSSPQARGSGVSNGCGGGACGH